MFRIIFISAMLMCGRILAQFSTGSISGKLTDAITGEEVVFANIILGTDTSGNTWKAVCSSDLGGNFTIKNVLPGTYILKAVYIGYQSVIVKNVVVKAGQNTNLNVTMKQNQVMLEEVEIVTRQTLVDRAMCYISSSQIKKSDMVSGALKKVAGRKGKQKKDAVSNTEQYNGIIENEYKSVKDHPLSTMSIDVDKASYSNVRRFLNQGTLPPVDAVRIEEMINYFNYSYPQPEGNVPFSITTEYAECPWNKKHNLVHIGIQGKDIKREKMQANNLVFLIDVSGSMSSDDKLPLVKSGLRLLVEQLRSEDRVSLVVYAGSAGLVLPSTPGSDKKKIIDAIDKLDAGGSTAGGVGIQLAYKIAAQNFIEQGNNRVILATDGDFNVGVSNDGELIKLIEQKRSSGIYLTVLGFGTGNLKDSKMEQLADKGNGNYAYVDNIKEAKKILVKEMGGTLVTIAKDVKIQVVFNPLKVKAYRLVGYENRLLRDEDFDDDTKDAGELGSGHTVTAIYEIIPAISDEPVKGINERRYQRTFEVSDSQTDPVMTVKFRYKNPKELSSNLLVATVEDKRKTIEKTSESCRFSAAVAQFGMLLRDSQFKGEADFKSTIILATEARGTDDDGYRAEFIHLVEKAQVLKSSVSGYGMNANSR